MMTDIDDKPPELIFQCLQRAHMMQSLSEAAGINKDTGFTTGLFSSLDALMDQPMDKVLDSLPLAEEITQALLKREGKLGELLEAVLHYERGEWQDINADKFKADNLSKHYIESLSWTTDLVKQFTAQ